MAQLVETHELGLVFAVDKPPVLIFGLGRWRFGRLHEQFFQVCLWCFKECIEVDVVHQHDSDHSSQSREAPRAIQAPLQKRHEKICYQCDPDLNLDGICTLAIEVSEREILLNLFE